MKRAILPGLVVLALAAAGPSVGQVVVSSEWIALQDVAPVAGEAGETLLGPAPPPGRKMALDPAFVTAVAAEAGVVLALPLDKPIWVSRADPDEAHAAPTARKAPTPPIAREAPIARAAQDPGTSLSGGLAGPPSPAHVLVVARTMRRGDVLTSEDLEWTDPAGTAQGAAARTRFPVTRPADVVGKAVRRNLPAGAALSELDLEAPDLVRKGSPVTLVYLGRGLRLTVDGSAQNDAALGEKVRVLNNYSKRAVDAVVTAAGEAQVMTR